ncbi:SDR family NAD(P)-dependent oxidoreductase [Novosphingobium sp. JCM 18896]|uniref:SDR family NAD(P)-dependent oxidoreductase n=1 Tax=Novosphingobium sp. JCM 18896 TaxID=2989731 RepID=UPI002221887F|nr:SDR family oxidoreductase [Novosphingobium sp. JCM 18896]MCW1428193.1 SDR family oxidoreductase [Novosphingobium sp. JCM 18896]
MEGKVAIVTGGGGGIGAGIVRALGAKGVKVVATGRNEGKLARFGEELGSSIAYSSIAVDATAADAPKAIVEHALEKFGRLDMLVNNAGSFNFGPVHSTTDDMLDEVLGISLRAPFRLTREALPHLGQGSSILFVGSTWGIYGTPGGGAYSAVKAAQIGLMQTLAAEYGPQGIRSNYIAPTVVRTEMTDAFWDLDFFRRTNHELTPFPGECTVDDIGNMAAFLASDLAGFVNGQTIAVDGGISTTRYLAPEAVNAERK